MPARFSGEKSPAALEMWVYQMQLYLVAANVPEEQWTIVSATNMEGAAALWVQAQAQPAELAVTSWYDFVQGLRQAFIPRDVSNRYMAQFLA